MDYNDVGVCPPHAPEMDEMERPGGSGDKHHQLSSGSVRTDYSQIY